MKFAIALEDATEGAIVYPEAIAFDRENWSTGVDVLIEGVDDDEQDYDQTYTITMAWLCGDPSLKSATAEVKVVNEDTDVLRVMFDSNFVQTHELGGGATVRVWLSRPPQEPVDVNLVTDAENEVSFTPETLHFTSNSYSQEVRILGRDDLRRDGDQTILMQALAGGHPSGVILVNNRELSLAIVTTEEVGKSRLSSDGRYLMFDSRSAELAPFDNNHSDDVFVRDLATGTIERVSVSNDGGELDGSSFAGGISSDGRYAYFAFDGYVYCRDRVARTTTKVPTVGFASNPDLSSNGAYLLVLDDGEESVYEVSTGALERISFDVDGSSFAIPAEVPRPCDHCVSNDGRFALFSRRSGIYASQLYLRDRLMKQTRLLSADSQNQRSDGMVLSASMSGNGGTVLFNSDASDLPTSPERPYRILAYDIDSSRFWQLTLGTFSVGFRSASISDDGATIAFGGIHPYTSDNNDLFALHLPERRFETLDPWSLAPSFQAYPRIEWVSISGNGRYLAFSTENPLVGEDRDDQIDLYVMQLP